MTNELNLKMIESIGKNSKNGVFYIKDIKQASISTTYEATGNGTHTLFTGESGKNTIITGVLIQTDSNSGEISIKNGVKTVLKLYASKSTQSGAANIHLEEEEGTITVVTDGLGASDKTFFGVSYITEEV